MTTAIAAYCRRLWRTGRDCPQSLTGMHYCDRPDSHGTTDHVCACGDRRAA